MNKFQKNLNYGEKEFSSKMSFQNEKLELLGPRKVLEIEVLGDFDHKSLEFEK